MFPRVKLQLLATHHPSDWVSELCVVSHRRPEQLGHKGEKAKTPPGSGKKGGVGGTLADAPETWEVEAILADRACK